MELAEILFKKVEVGVREQPEDQRRQELYPEPDLDIHILPKDPEAIAEREGIHERIQYQIQHKGRGCRGSTVKNSIRMEGSPRSDNRR